MGASHSLEDKYTAERGSVFMNGTQALVRLPLVQMRRDQLAGLNTAAYISGYRGSPLGSYDQQLTAAQKHLQLHDVTFHPGVNEDLAATAIWGTQQVPLHQDALKQGVLGIWYGKGPGVDRSGDVFRHANAAGSSKHGGVLCLAGDDHGAKSSTVPHQSDHGFMSARMPMLYPSSVHEFIETGLLGIALSRYSGCWVGIKVISDTVETSAVVSLENEMRVFAEPSDYQLPEGGLNLRWPDPIMPQDVRLEEKQPAVLAFARANDIDQTIMDSANARFGIVASGKAFEDTRQALQLLGIDESAAELIGLRLYKVRMPWPLEPVGITAFANGLDEILVIEERREIIEHQIKQHLFNLPGAKRPLVIGKADEHGKLYLSSSATMSVAVSAAAIGERLLKRDLDESFRTQLQQRLNTLQARIDSKQSHVAPLERKPWFCSGCPHNTSTKVPEGSKALAGIGCHYMVQWMDRDTETFTQMGGEGMPWTSISHYVEDEHRFVNIGDGTFYHSGVLAIRAAVASGASMTYKVLFNDAVAMTGGQPVDGDLTAQQITRQLHAEGVKPIVLVSDEPEQFFKNDLAAGVTVRHRDELDAVMRELREVKGCSGIVYAQTCAAEKRRRRKRGTLVDPAQRQYINPAVCEGCGDCSVQSNCVSIEPLETVHGRKRRINQSSCNKDYSCVKGFCPSFVTVTGASLYKQPAQSLAADASIPDPALPGLDTASWNVLITGVGGTGVLTIGSIIGMAAHIDGNASMILDVSGLAQKGGAVVSHVRLARWPDQITSPQIVPGGTDLLLAADSVVAASADTSELLDSDRTHAVVNTKAAPVADFVLQRDMKFNHDKVAATIARQVAGADHFHAYSHIAEQLTGDAIAANIFMLGYAWQAGLLPVSGAALEQAIALNGVAVDANLGAFKWGRMLAANPEQVQKQVAVEAAEPMLATLSVDELVAQRQQHLAEYQSKRLAGKYKAMLDKLKSKTDSLGLDDSLLKTAAHNYARALSYKDEYEVARLFSLPAFKQQLQQQFTGDYKLEFNLAPPIMTRQNSDGRPAKRRFGPWVLKLFSVLRHGKKLRGTPLDVFGYSAERKQEREWIALVESDLNRVIDGLSAKTNLDMAQQILSLPDSVRGFGPVKHDAMQEAIAMRDSLWAQIDSFPVVKILDAA